MNAERVKEALRQRWPVADYVHLEEAALDTTRQGRKADFVAISCWRSRGYDVDVVEVKVSYTDWKRERDKPAKADLWWRYCDRFWIAAPAPLAERIRPELPAGWGLMAVHDAGARDLVKPERNQRTAFSWEQTIALLRSAQASGIGALRRAEDIGYRRGREEAKEEAVRVPVVAASKAELGEELLVLLECFEEETGVHLGNRWQIARLATAYAGLGGHARAERPADIADNLGYAADGLERQVANVRRLAALFAKAFPEEEPADG